VLLVNRDGDDDDDDDDDDDRMESVDKHTKCSSGDLFESCNFDKRVKNERMGLC
jgi:hypothetical protein